MLHSLNFDGLAANVKALHSPNPILAVFKDMKM